MDSCAYGRFHCDDTLEHRLSLVFNNSFSYVFFLTIWFMHSGCLDPENFKEFKLIKRAQLSHNVAKFTFTLPSSTSVLGLPIGQHISCRSSSLSLFICHRISSNLDTILSRVDSVEKTWNTICLL